VRVTISLLIFDVDGVLTDGRLAPGPDGDTEKMFSSQDGYAMKLWRGQGRKLALISGRKSLLVDRRAAELGVDFVFTGIETKVEAYEVLLGKAKVSESHVAFVGDDLPDLPVMRRCGIPLAVADAIPSVKRAATYVSRRSGGRGAAAELIEWLLRLDGAWSHARVGS
jgi:3-deoxy-D-manno-octulosonate 8-phosphate phosphatase (KDO 8-P phosphatase)